MKERENRTDIIFQKIVLCVSKVLDILMGIFLLCLLLFCVYNVVDDYQLAHAGDLQDSVLHLKPEDENAELSFEALQEINSDICAWLTIDNTNIDYPVVLGQTNSEYLDKGPTGEYSSAGSIFLDEQTSKDLSDDFIVFYGHNMSNSGMFADINKFKDADFFEKHQTGTLFTTHDTIPLTIIACLPADAYDGRIYRSTMTTDDFITYISQNAYCTREISYTPAQCYIFSTCADASSSNRTVVVAVPSER